MQLLAKKKKKEGGGGGGREAFISQKFPSRVSAWLLSQNLKPGHKLKIDGS